MEMKVCILIQSPAATVS